MDLIIYSCSITNADWTNKPNCELTKGIQYGTLICDLLGSLREYLKE